jgi:hypothetical protein
MEAAKTLITKKLASKAKIDNIKLHPKRLLWITHEKERLTLQLKIINIIIAYNEDSLSAALIEVTPVTTRIIPPQRPIPIRS